MVYKTRRIAFVLVFLFVSSFALEARASILISIKNSISDFFVIINSSVVRATRDGFCSRYYRDLDNGSYITKIREKSALEVCSSFASKGLEKNDSNKITPVEIKKTSSDKTISDILNTLSPVSGKYLDKNISEIEKLETVEKKVEPLKEEISVVNNSGLNLSVAGIFSETNNQRILNGLSALKEDDTLKKIAEKRMDDMFSLGYFDHTSPKGETVGSFAKSEGYKYLVIGENIALGDFSSDRDLVQAWMASPGHKANILNANYQEIGIAVSKKIYQGNQMIISVQVFAKSSRSCIYPDESLRNKIMLYTESLKGLVSSAEKMRKELEYMKENGLSAVDYNNKVNEYNLIAKSANNLSLEIKILTENYNTQVGDYNNCINKI